MSAKGKLLFVAGVAAAGALIVTQCGDGEHDRSGENILLAPEYYGAEPVVANLTLNFGLFTGETGFEGTLSHQCPNRNAIDTGILGRLPNVPDEIQLPDWCTGANPGNVGVDGSSFAKADREHPFLTDFTACATIVEDETEMFNLLEDSIKYDEEGNPIFEEDAEIAAKYPPKVNLVFESDPLNEGKLSGIWIEAAIWPCNAYPRTTTSNEEAFWPDHYVDDKLHAKFVSTVKEQAVLELLQQECLDGLNFEYAKEQIEKAVMAFIVSDRPDLSGLPILGVKLQDMEIRRKFFRDLDAKHEDLIRTDEYWSYEADDGYVVMSPPAEIESSTLQDPCTPKDGNAGAQSNDTKPAAQTTTTIFRAG